MARILYELAGRDDRRASPFCWRARLALAHKRLPTVYEPCRYTGKDKIAFSGRDRYPVLVDGNRVVPDSWDIACYLDEAYPNRPMLFGTPANRGIARFLNEWADMLDQFLFPAIVLDCWKAVHPDDRTYYRAAREARFGRTLEAVQADRPHHAAAVAAALPPLRRILATQPWLAGEAPAYADYAVFGVLQWTRCVSSWQYLDRDDPIYEWRSRMIRLFDGLADSVPHYDW
ncbi:MAG: glutathione S-transferase N-terminal domain-containing protein [Alphaproteobacteria bacterium]